MRRCSSSPRPVLSMLARREPAPMRTGSHMSGLHPMVISRWPAFRVPEDWDALYSPDSGFLLTVPRCVAWQMRRARSVPPSSNDSSR